MIETLRWRARRLAFLLGRARASLALRGWRGTLARIGDTLGPAPREDRSLELLPLEPSPAPFEIPRAEHPRVSVIIPAYGQCAFTVACLRSIARQGATAPFEVIVVDDASPDDTRAVLAGMPGLRLHSNQHNLGFVGSCNAGATLARGDYLLFLNNDTQVQSRWLDALLDCFLEQADCGLAGSRLVYPDGRLQEAGGLIFRDGSAWNIGRFEPRDDPAYRYRRPVDYVSGASLMIPRALFEQLGGFDTRYAPAYYEDTDLAFAVRATGRTVCYQPDSLVVHFEGATAGRDPSQGVKQHQLRHQGVFERKWRQALAAHPPAGTPIADAMHHRLRGQVLVVDSTMPDPARDSGSVRLCAILRLLVAQGWQVSFAPDDGRADDAAIARLGALGVQTLCRPWVPQPADWLARHGTRLSAAVLCRHTVAGQYAALVRRHAPAARLVFDTVDLHFLREERAARVHGRPALARQAEQSRRSELALVQAADVTLVVSPHEQRLLHELVPAARIEVLSNIHEPKPSGAPWSTRRDLVFIGGHGHPPNADAMQWLAERLVPALQARWPGIQVHVLGDVPPAVVSTLGRPGLQFHGRVAELAPWLDGALASLAPLRFGAGVKGKVNTAMSHGLPVIATSIAAEGMLLTDGEDVLIADDEVALVAAVGRLMADPELWQRLSAAGREHVTRHYSPARADATLRGILG